MIMRNSLFFFIFICILKDIINDCGREQPILKNGKCQLIYCSDKEYNTSICTINNKIVKTQWLNNIIKISEDNFRYINVVSNLKGDMFIETSPISGSSKRIFYALKNNGRYYFINSENNEETPFFIMNEMSEDLPRHESNLLNIVLNNDDNKEYLMSISAKGSVEIYDFVNKERKHVPTTNFLGLTLKSLYNIHLLNKYNNNYNILIPTYSDGDYISLKRYQFSSIDISNTNSYKGELSKPLSSVETEMLSCLQTSSKKIVCIYAQHVDSKNYYSYFVVGEDLKVLDHKIIVQIIEPDFSSIFFKGLHLKNEIIALYYYYTLITNKGFLVIRKIDSKNNLVTINDYPYIRLDRAYFHTTIEYNDFIKLNDNKLCVASLSSTNIMYIITATLFNDDKDVIIYYYSIDFYKLYNLNINGDIKIHNFNNFITFSSSVCQHASCNSKDVFSTLTIFSYPNCEDVKIDLFDNLINDFEIYLTNYFKIENNIFGYILQKIKIISVFKDDHLKVIKKNDNSIISDGSELNENEILKLYNDGKNKVLGEYKIEYAAVVTESDFIDHIKYPERNDTLFQLHSDYSKFFEKSSYVGKTAYYIINIIKKGTSDSKKDSKTSNSEKSSKKSDKSNDHGEHSDL